MELEEALEAIVAFLHAGQSVSHIVSTGAGMVLAFVAVIHLIQCFFGFKLFKLFTAVIGGVVGFFVGMLFAVIINIPQLAVVFAPLMAVAGALVAFRAYQIGVFFYTGTIPALLWFALVEPREAAILVLILFGALGIFLARPYIIAITALPSGLIAGISIMIVFRVDNAPAGIFFGLILSVAGFVFQWYTTRNAPRPKTGWSRTAPDTSVESAPVPEPAAPAPAAVKKPTVQRSKPPKAPSKYVYTLYYLKRPVIALLLGIWVVYIGYQCRPMYGLYSVYDAGENFAKFFFLLAICFVAGSLKKVPRGPDGKAVRTMQTIRFGQAPCVYVLKKPRPVLLAVGIVLLLVYQLNLSGLPVSYQYSYYPFGLRLFAFLVPYTMQAAGWCLTVGSFLYRVESPKTEEWATGEQSAAAGSQEVDWKALAGAGLQTLEETVKGFDLPETLKHIGEYKFQFALGQPKLPWFAAGVLLVLLGIGLDAALLSLLGLAAIVASLLHRISDSDQTNKAA